MAFNRKVKTGELEEAHARNERVTLAIVPTPGTKFAPCFGNDSLDVANRGAIVAKATFALPIYSLRAASKEVAGGNGLPVRYFVVTVPAETEYRLFGEGRGGRPTEDVRLLPNKRPFLQTTGNWQRALRATKSGARGDNTFDWEQASYDVMVCHEESITVLPGLQQLPWVEMPKNTFEASFVVDQANEVEVGVESFMEMSAQVVTWDVGAHMPGAPAPRQDRGYWTAGGGVRDLRWRLEHVGSSVVTTPVPGARGAERNVATGFSVRFRFEWKGEGDMEEAKRSLCLPTTALCPRDLRMVPGTDEVWRRAAWQRNLSRR